MRRALFAALALSALMPLQALSGTVTVRSGDTLSDIADRYGVSVGSLMRLNGLRNSNHVEAGQRLRVPGPRVTAGAGRHTVARGESLSTIASRYRVSERDLITLNHLRDANHVEVGQRLRLPSNAVLPQPKAAKTKPVPVNPVPNASSHTIARGQTLTQIAKAYEVPVASLVDINGLTDPNKVKVGTKLLLRQAPSEAATSLSTQSVIEPSPSNSNATSNEAISTGVAPARDELTSARETASSSSVEEASITSATPNAAVQPATTASKSDLIAKASTKPAASVAPNQADWRSYGPLKVDWSNWQTMAGSDVAPTLNADGKPLYIAVNCGARKINVTGANGAWKTWNAPQNNYEQDLVKDRCRQGSGA